MFSSRTLFRCFVQLENCTLNNNLKAGPPIFSKPIETFKIYETNTKGLPSRYGIMGHQKTEFLNCLAMKYIPTPPMSRQYPSMAETNDYDQIEYLNFKESSGLDKVHLSARYESYSFKGVLEMSDDVNSVKNYITGDNNYNKNTKRYLKPELVDKIIADFNLSHLTNKWINSLSNGQLRRARIAKSILHNPKLLIIDDPFLGLDPVQTDLVSKSLDKVSETLDMSIVLGLRFQDKVPEWISHLAEITEEGVVADGEKSQVLPKISQVLEAEAVPERQVSLQKIQNQDLPDEKNLFIEFNNASVVYKEVPVLANFNWKVPKGSNWRILGENGTGKTTILSLITADHPQSWRSVLSINGILRKTGSGVTFFDVNNKIGISSPELHSLVPSTKTMSQIIKNGLVKDIGNSNFMFSGDKLEYPNDKIKTIIHREFGDIIHQFGDTTFNELSITHQKLTLFLRSIAKDPELIILDEAFSCMDDIGLMKKCHQILDHYFKESTVLTIGHIEWELPNYDYVLQLVGDQNRSYNLYKVEYLI